MQYDPIKDRFGQLVAGRSRRMRLFFSLLQFFFLRAWYVRRELRRQILARSSKGPIRILDAGTGFGQFSYWIARHYPQIRIHAVDIKQDYLDTLQELFKTENLSERATFAIDDLTDLQAKGPYDLILSIDVMEHIEEDEQVFRHFERVLAPGGVVIINTPSDQGGSDVHDEAADSFIGEHVRDGYNAVELVEKLSRAGLTTSRVLYTYGRPGSLAWKLLIKGPMRLLNLSWAFIVVLPFYYVPILPLGAWLNWLDMRRPNETGTGLLVVAEKSSEGSSGSPINSVF